MTAAGGTPTASSSKAAPAPARMLVTAAIMLALVKDSSAIPARISVLASAAATDGKNLAAAGSGVA